MTRTATIGRQIEFLTSVDRDGIPIRVIELAVQSSESDVRVALKRAKNAHRVAEVRPGIFRVETGVDLPALPKRELQSLRNKLRKAIRATPPAAQMLSLARMLLHLKGPQALPRLASSPKRPKRRVGSLPISHGSSLKRS